MAEGASSFPFMGLLFLLTVCTSGVSPLKPCEQEELKIEEKQNFHCSPRLLLHNLQLKATQHDTLTTLPTTPVTVSPETIPTPTIVTVPATNPESTPVTPVTVPSANPVTSPVPVTNPVTTPSTPVTNPVTTYPPPSTGVPATTPVTNPVSPPVTPVTNPVSPPATTGSPAAVPGQSWCVAKSGVLESSLQAALDYACGIGGADCSGIQQGSSCYNPISLQSHASFAFNSYYQKNPSPTSCDFGGTAMITNTNPSSGTCIYPSSSSPVTATTPTTPATGTPTTPATTTPTTPATSMTPTTPATSMTPTMPTTITPTPTTSSSGAIVPVSASPPVFNTSNPASDSTTVFGDNPPSANSSTSLATNLQPFTGCIILVISVVTGRLILDK